MEYVTAAQQHAEGSESTAGPRISEWGGVREDLAVVIDKLSMLKEAVVASGGGKAKKVQPYPRPKTAADTVKSMRTIDRMRKLREKFESLPHR